jgi:hypothetical protein
MTYDSREVPETTAFTAIAQTAYPPPDKQDAASETPTLDATAEKQLEMAYRQQEVLDAEQARNQRRDYASKLFNLITCWLVFVGLVLMAASGNVVTPCYTLGLKISDPVLIALLTTTTFNVLGLFVIVAKGLFPSKDRSGRIQK